MRYLICLLITLSAAQAEIKVFFSDGDIKVYDSMSVSGSKMNFSKKDSKGSINKNVSEIERIIQPAPPHVQSMIKAFKMKKYDAISEKGGAVLKAYEQSGWGRLLTYIYSTSLIRQGKVKEAVKVINAGRFLIKGGNEDEDVLLNCALAESGLRIGKADEMIKKVPVTEFGKAAFYALQAKFLEAQNKPNLAVLSYYKAFMIGGNHPDCSESLDSVNRIYKNLNDPRKVPESLLTSK